MTSINDVFHPDQNLIAYRVACMECHPVRIESEDAIPDKDLISPYSLVRPLGGYVRIDGIGCIPADQPGLYRIYRLSDAACVQWLVRDDDIVTFAGAVATIFYHIANEPADVQTNNSDSMLKMLDYFLSNAPHGKVGGVCITAANAFALLCLEAGFDAVLWEFQDVQTAYNPVRTHVMTEIRDPKTGKSVLVDIDRKFIMKSDAGDPLSCRDYIDYSTSGQNFTIVPISNAKIAGFGATPRVPKVLDFAVELFELGGDGYRQEIIRSIGNSLLIKGIRYYDGNSVFTLPGIPARIKDFLSETEEIPDRDRVLLESVMQYPEAEF